MSNVIKVGDKIMYRPCFGMDAPKVARVENLQVTRIPRSKDGAETDWVTHWVTHDQVKSNMVLFDLDDGHWCYSDQIVLDRKH